MPSARAFQVEPAPVDQDRRGRRTPPLPENLDPAYLQENASLLWPTSWPATLHAGKGDEACTVHIFSATGAQIGLSDPPPVGTAVSLKFPFTVFLTGRVAWSQGKNLGIEFDAETRRSARIVEDVLLDKLGI